MKKNFFTICFILSFFTATSAWSDVIPLAGMGDVKARAEAAPKPNEKVPGMPDPRDEDAVRKFFKKRFEEAARSPMSENVDWNKPDSISVIHTPEYYKAQEEKNKSIFQKIYDEALDAMHKAQGNTTPSLTASANSEASSAEQQAAQTATRFFILAPEEQTPTTAEPEIPTVSLSLPSGRRILAPAQEHIPYFLSYIDIQSNGYIKIEDTITIVANGQKFAHGLNRVFPKYAYDQNNHSNRIELLLDSVTVNNTKVPYMAEEIGKNIIIKPKYNQKLEPGVYTYKFKYLVNYKLQREKGLVYLDWNLTGRPLNAFITSANAIVTLPEGYSFQDAQTIIGRSGKYTTRRTNMFRLAKNVIAFSNRTPLFNNEEMSIVAVMDRNVFIKDFDKNYGSFLTDWGKPLYAGLGFLTILCSFILSLISLRKERKANKYNPSYSGSLMRSILVGKYDRTAFVSQLLELYRKDAIDIKNENNRSFLVRKNISGPRLTKNEKKALRQMFPKKTTEMEINNANNLLLKKAKRFFEKNIKKQIKKYRLMHNIGYILFSVAMLLLTEIFIAFLSINMAQSITILLSTTLLFSFYIWILRHKFKYKIISLPIKIFSLLAIIVIWIISSLYIDAITGLFIIAMLATIFEFSHIFNEQNNFINEAKETIGTFKEYLVSNAEAINLSRDFINQQSNIFALDISEHYPQNVSNQKSYKLDIADTIKQTLIGIL